MDVDTAKPRKRLVVHGVQTGTDEDIHVDKKIEELEKGSLLLLLLIAKKQRSL